MKKIGRLILIIVGIVMLSVSIPVLISNWSTVTSASWDSWEHICDNASLLWSVVTLGMDALFGLIALLGGVVGKKSMILALFALILIASPAYTLYLTIQAGTALDFAAIMLFVQQFTIPVFYFIGFILV